MTNAPNVTAPVARGRVRALCMRDRCIAAVLGLGALFATVSSTAAARQVDTTGTAVYLVREGDTLYALAARLGMDVGALAAINPGVAGILSAGDTLRVPVEELAREYTVKPGDTLFAVSRQFGVTPEEIQRANRMSDSVLQVGQTLVVPAQGVRDEVPLDGVHPASVTTGIALVYPDVQKARMLSSGIVYDPERFTISHPELPIGSIVFVRSEATGKSTFAEVADRGTMIEPGLIDVSAAVIRQLGLEDETAGQVEVRLIDERN